MNQAQSRAATGVLRPAHGQNLSLSQLLRETREQAGLSLGKLALRSGVNKATLSRWEKDLTAPRIPELTVVLDAMCVPNSQRGRFWAAVGQPRAVAILRREVDAPILHPGDYLRALRARSGKSQGEVARQINVTPSKIGKWERGELLAGGGELHDFCHACGASPDEAAFLTVAVVPNDEVVPPNREIVYQRLYDVAIHSPKAGRDIKFLALSAQMESLIGRGKADGKDLAAVWGRYAECLNYQGRFAESVPVAHRVRDALARDGGKLGYHATAAAMAVTESIRKSFGPRNALHFLEPWAYQISATDGRAWAAAKLADLRGLLGDVDRAMVDAERAYDLVASNPVEAYFRRTDLMSVLIRAGLQYPKGLPRLLELCDGPEPAPSVELGLRDELYRGLALVYLGSHREASALASRLQPTLFNVENPVAFHALHRLWNRLTRHIAP